MKKDPVFALIAYVAILFSGTAHVEAQTDKIVHQGKFEADSYFTTFEGDWKIVQTGARLFVVLSENFKAKKAPDLKIFLSKLPLDDINGKNATSKGEPLLVGKLTNYKGSARYEIPGSPELAQYKSLIVHCEEYNKFWGGSSLQ